MKKKLLSILFSLGIVGIFFSAPSVIMGAVLPQTVAVFETSLASPITSSASSMTLTANSVRGGSTLSGYNCFTVDEGSAQAEFICGTVSGTSVTALVRGVDPATGTSTVSSLQFAHRRGAKVKITDFPSIVIMRHQLNGSDSIYNLIRYDTNVLIAVGSPTSTLATKYYVDNVVTGGAANADETTKGLVELATAREAASSTSLGGTSAALAIRSAYATDTPVSGCAVGFTSTPGAGCVPVARLDGKISANFIATSSVYNWTGQHTFNSTTTLTGTTTGGVSYLGQFMQLVSSTTINTASSPVPVFIATSTNALVISEADVATTTDFLGFATSTNVTNGATGTVQISGIVNGFSGLTKGLAYYVQDTRGTIGTTKGTAELYVGTAYSATQILLDRKDANLQYLGSATCTVSPGSNASIQCDTSNDPASYFARFANVKVDLTCGGRQSSHSYLVPKVSGYAVGMATFDNTGAANNGVAISSVSWTSTSSLRAVGSNAASTGIGTITLSANLYR